VAQPHHRVFALVLALLFLGTSVATGVAVIWQIRKDNEASKALQESQDQDGQSSLDAINSDTNQQGENRLQGTKLNEFTPVATVDKLQIIDLREGTGDPVPAGATITAHYTGAVAADGTIFQSSHDTGEPVQFSLSGVIKGWTDGVPGMKVGGKRRLIIPADQAYGATPPSGSGIPANAPLVFDIELVSVP
jgi:peptidylprolyl isomerase